MKWEENTLADLHSGLRKAIAVVSLLMVEGLLNSLISRVVALPDSPYFDPGVESEPLVTGSGAELDGRVVEGDAMAQVTPVFELRDVSPDDWAYEALESLSNRYNIPLGFPDRTYRGDRNMTRYEFAAVMIPALERLMEALIKGEEDLIHPTDLRLIQRLQTDYKDILEESQARIIDLEMRTQTLERQLFSPTTQLDGEAILALTDGTGYSGQNQTAGQYQVWLELNTHFSQRDALHTRLIMGDGGRRERNRLDDASPDSSVAPESATDVTGEGTLIQNSRGNTQDGVGLDRLAYVRSFGDRANDSIGGTVYVSAKGGTHSDYVDTLSPLGTGFQGDGAISVFGQASPIYTIGGGTGIGVEWAVDPAGIFSVSTGYFSEQAAVPDAGLFNRDYAALGQLTVRPSDDFALGITYVHGYHTPGNAIFDAGLDSAIAGTGFANSAHSQFDTPALTHSYGVQTAFELNRQFSLYGFGGYTDVQFIEQGDGELWFYGLGLAVENWLIPQTSGGLIIGVEPYLAGLDHGGAQLDNDTPMHLEAFYTVRLSDQVAISPGMIWLMAPNQSRSNRDRVIATLRTTLKF